MVRDRDTKVSRNLMHTFHRFGIGGAPLYTYGWGKYDEYVYR
jgi:hypothetical protein